VNQIVNGLLVFGWLFIIACHSPSDTSNEQIVMNTEDTQIKPKPVYIKNVEEPWWNLKTKEPSFIITMPYASKDNFLKEKIYPCPKCYLREDAAKALINAQKEALNKDLKIIIYDCYRPLPLQQKMFDSKPDSRYVADPKRGSKHNKGVAVDISLATKYGEPLEMGSAFDDFSDKANYYNKSIPQVAKKNRKLLRDIMLANDFTPYDTEWWHFNYKNINFPNEDFIWECDE